MSTLWFSEKAKLRCGNLTYSVLVIDSPKIILFSKSRVKRGKKTMFGERILGVALNSKVLWRNCTMKTLPVEKRANIQQVRTFAPPQYHYNPHIAAEHSLQSIQL